MFSRRRLTATTASLALAIGAVFAGGGVAAANSDYSSKVYYPNSAYLWSYAYISDSANSQGCGNFNTWAKITKTPSWIKLTDLFTRTGFGSITVGGVTGTTSGGDVTLTWTNSNGALGSYLSGNVCIPWSVIYLHLQAVGTSLQYGTVRTAQTRVL